MALGSRGHLNTTEERFANGTPLTLTRIPLLRFNELGFGETQAHIELP